MLICAFFKTFTKHARSFYSTFIKKRKFQSEKSLLQAGIKNHLSMDRLVHNSEFLFGVHPVHLAIKMKKRSLYRLLIKESLLDPTDNNDINPYISEIWEMCDLIGLPIEPSSKKSLDFISNQRPHQGVMLECSSLPFPLFNEQSMPNFGNGLFVFLDEIKDVMNFGNILRSCAFFGVSAVFIPCDSSVSPFPMISKLSSGALEIVPLLRVNNKVECLTMLAAAGVTIVGTSGERAVATSKTIDLGSVDSCVVAMLRRGPTLLVLGREDQGLTSGVANLCHHFLRIPSVDCPRNLMTSLNVAIATGIFLNFLKHGNI